MIRFIDFSRVGDAMAPAKRGGAHNRHHQLKQLSGGVKRLFGKLSVAIIVLVICTVSLLSSTKTYKPPASTSKVFAS